MTTERYDHESGLNISVVNLSVEHHRIQTNDAYQCGCLDCLLLSDCDGFDVTLNLNPSFELGADNELMRSSTRRYGPRTYFVPPPEAAYVSLLVYSCLLEEVRLVRVGDENAINAFHQ